jgi:hypothetical protein
MWHLEPETPASSSSAAARPRFIETYHQFVDKDKVVALFRKFVQQKSIDEIVKIDVGELFHHCAQVRTLKSMRHARKHRLLQLGMLCNAAQNWIHAAIVLFRKPADVLTGRITKANH